MYCPEGKLQVTCVVEMAEMPECLRPFLAHPFTRLPRLPACAAQAQPDACVTPLAPPVLCRG